MSVRQTIVSRVEAFLARTGMSERRFGLAVCNDHKLVERMRRESVTLARIEAAERFIAARDPDAVEAANDRARQAGAAATLAPVRHPALPEAA